MSTFTTSKRTRGQHVSPKWTSAPYHVHPSRREFIHGRIVGLPDARDPLWWRVGRIIMVLCAVYALKLAVIG